MKKIIIVLVCSFLIVNCEMDTNRRIKLSADSFTGLSRGKAATIQLAAARKRSIAIIHLTNETNSTSLDWLQSGIVEMLGSDLAQSRQFYLIPSSLTTQTLLQLRLNGSSKISPDSAKLVARQLRTFAYLTGRYYQHRDTLIIDTELRRTEDGSLLGSQNAKALRLENVFTMVDQLTRNLKNDLQSSLRQVQTTDADVALRPTQSVEAYKSYIQGIDYLDKLYYTQALPCFERAITLDSTFVSGYIYLARIYNERNERDKARLWLAKGLQYAEKAPLRDKLNLQALDAAFKGEISQLLGYYQEICELYPEDATALFNLGSFLYNLRRYQEAIDYLEAAANINPKLKLAYNMLGYSYAQLYKVDLARQAMKKYALLAEKEPNPYDSLGEILLRFGLVDEAIDSYEKALEIDPNFRFSSIGVCTAYLENGENGKAEKKAEYLIKTAEQNMDKIRALITMAQVQLVKEDTASAIQSLEQAIEVDHQSMAALNFLIQLDLNPVADIQRVEKWLQHVQTLDLPQLINYNGLFALASYCCKYQVGLTEMDSILNIYSSNVGSPFFKTIASGYRQIFHTFEGKTDVAALFRLDDEAQKDVLHIMPPIQWEVFWQYYYLSLLHSSSDPKFLKQLTTEQLNMARRGENLTFEVQYGNALALLETLSGSTATAEEIRNKFGVPNEKDWQFCGPFPARRGLYESFPPEENISENATDVWNEGFDGLPDGYINLKKIFNTKLNFTGYARLTFTSTKAQIAMIRFGVNRPVKIWLNDELLLTQCAYDVTTMDNNMLGAKLRAGTNYIMIKMSSYYGNGGFYLRISDKKGYGLPDIIFGEANLM